MKYVKNKILCLKIFINKKGNLITSPIANFLNLDLRIECSLSQLLMGIAQFHRFLPMICGTFHIHIN